MPSIDFRELPLSGGLSKLFHDYLYNFPKVKNFYTSDFRSLDNVSWHAERASKSQNHRSTLCDVLADQNKSFGSSQKAFDNINLLRQETTFCVVTGQQVGILGGPLYTAYKAFTAIKLASALSEKFSRFQFVPLFWLEGEDHDFAEANHIFLLSQESVPRRIEYLMDGKPVDRNVGAVGEIVFDNSLEAFLDEIQKVLPSTEFRSSLLSLVRGSFATGRTFNQAFSQWISKLSGNGSHEGGLVFLSSNDRRIKRLLGPVFLKELQEYPRSSQLVIDQSAVLEKEYHAQIKPKALNLFLFHRGGRYLIEPRENDFSLKGTRYFPTRDELLLIAADTPELLSPNVVLRTICQDTLLPTVVYVAGPSEIAYFAQLKPVYELFDLTMPIIYPRASITIVEEKLRNILDKYELRLVDFFGNRQKLNDRVIDLLSEVDLGMLFGDATKRVEEMLGELKFGLNYIDPTLAGAADTTRGKIESQLHVLKEKAAEAQRRKHEIALRQVDKVLNNVFPDGSFQERELNILHFMNKYGLDFPARLFDEIHGDVFAHQVIEL